MQKREYVEYCAAASTGYRAEGRAAHGYVRELRFRLHLLLPPAARGEPLLLLPRRNHAISDRAAAVEVWVLPEQGPVSSRAAHLTGE
jgi:hypothetical protein